MGDGCKLEILLANSKNDQNKEKNRKPKANQLRNKKQRLKHMKNKDKTCQWIIDEAFSTLFASRFGLGLAFSLVATRSSASGPSAFGPSVSEPSASEFSASNSFASHFSSFSSSISAEPFYLITLSLFGYAFSLIISPT